MIQSNPFQLSCHYFHHVDSSLGIDDIMHQFDSFSPPFTSTDDSLETSHANFSSISDIDVENFPFHFDGVQFQLSVDDYSLDNLKDLNPYSIMEMDEMRDLFECGDKSDSSPQPIDQEDKICNSSQFSPSMISSDTPVLDVTYSILPTLTLPTEDMEIENELSANHLAKTYAEAMENEQRELAGVITERINEKVSPVAKIRERLLYHSFQPLGKQQAENYLKRECSKVFDAAFEAIYRMLPNGMFAHFRANSAILEAMPYDAEVLHVVDFDMGEGLQWSSMIMAIAQQQNLLLQHGIISQQITLKVTSIKWKEDNDLVSSQWRFEETKNRLYDCAYSHGLKLKMKEKELQNLVSEIKKMKKNGGGIREWLAFNCMHALPHMGRRRSRREVISFLRVAKEYLLANSSNNKSSNNRGIITYGDGENWEKIRNCSSFGSFFDISMDHYQALLQSMERNFPTRLAKARIAMESLFVAPLLSTLALFEEWKKIKQVGDEFRTGFGLQGARFSNESLVEANLMVRELGESLYSVRCEGENENEMVLEWNGTPLVRVSAWR